MIRASDMNIDGRHSGFTLVEVMIVVAILSILGAIAIPAYNGYLYESKLATARANVEPLRLALESHWLDNGSYADFDGLVWDPSGAQTLDADPTNWHPSGDEGQYKYTVDADADNWGVLVENVNDGRAWARVEKGGSGNMTSCYGDTDGATTNACPGGGSGGS